MIYYRIIIKKGCMSEILTHSDNWVVVEQGQFLECNERVATKVEEFLASNSSIYPSVAVVRPQAKGYLILSPTIRRLSDSRITDSPPIHDVEAGNVLLKFSGNKQSIQALISAA